MRLLFVLSIMLALSGCSSNEDYNSSGDLGNVRAIVSGSKSFNPNISAGVIKKYRISVYGEGEDAIVSEFDGAKSEGVINNISPGRKTIVVEALNANSSKIREGEANEVSVKPGQTTDVEVNMESIPVFTNLSDGNSIPNTRFVAKIFAEPGHPLVLEDNFNSVSENLYDISSNSSFVYADVESGLVKVLTKQLPAGEHLFKIRDRTNNRYTEVKIYLTEGAKIGPAPVFGSTSPFPSIVNGGTVFR